MPPKNAILDPSKDAAANARTVLPALASSYFRLGRRVFKRTPGPGTLHRLRLATKRFRYTLELFRPCYGAALERRIESLQRIQRCLGEISDCLAARMLLERLGEEGDSASAIVMEFLGARVARRSAEVRRYWIRTFDAPRQEAAWKGYLVRFAGHPQPGRR